MDCVTGSGFYFDKNDNLIFKMEKETVVYGLGLSNPNAPFLITDYEKLKNFILPLLNDSIAENEGKVSFGVVLDTIFENACEVDESESGVRSFDLSCNDEYEEWQKELRQYKEGS